MSSFRNIQRKGYAVPFAGRKTVFEYSDEEYSSDDETKEEESTHVTEFKHDGITYWKDSEENLYDPKSHEFVGVWDNEQSKILLDVEKKIRILSINMVEMKGWDWCKTYTKVPEYVISVYGAEPRTIKLTRAYQYNHPSLVAIVLEALDIIDDYSDELIQNDIKNGRYQLRNRRNEEDMMVVKQLIDTDTRKVYDLSTGKVIGEIGFYSIDNEERTLLPTIQFNNICSKKVKDTLTVDYSACERTGKISLHEFLTRQQKILADWNLEPINQKLLEDFYHRSSGLNVGHVLDDYEDKYDLLNYCDRLFAGLRMINYKKWNSSAKRVFKTILNNKRHPYYWGGASIVKNSM
tara:strand:- start:365 stop:1411 length:1047 start_codon:yes stop_codon:yes gene_type:complete